MKHRTLPITLVLSLFITPLAPAQYARQPVPNSSKQSPVLYKIKSDYKTEYGMREAADQLSLASTFLKEARQPATDPVKKYVLLREARELAVNGGDLAVAFDAIDETA